MDGQIVIGFCSSIFPTKFSENLHHNGNKQPTDKLIDNGIFINFLLSSPLSSIGSPITFMIRPRVTLPTGT
jgi:hypothetical protein